MTIFHRTRLVFALVFGTSLAGCAQTGDPGPFAFIENFDPAAIRTIPAQNWPAPAALQPSPSAIVAAAPAPAPAASGAAQP